MNPEMTIEALDYLTTGDREGYEGQYHLRNPQGYADLGGIMTWSINWDKSEDGGTAPYEFADAYSTYFNNLAAQPDPNNPQPDPGSGRPSPLQPPSAPLVPDEENKPKVRARLPPCSSANAGVLFPPVVTRTFGHACYYFPARAAFPR